VPVTVCNRTLNFLGCHAYVAMQQLQVDNGLAKNQP
jgi:hypothetical protein